MEFFHALIYGSGFGELITNVAELSDPVSGELTELVGEYAILWIPLKNTEINQLKDYLEGEFGKPVDDEKFETYMSRAFYNGSPIVSEFDLRKFMQICSQLNIAPKTYFYRYEQV